MVNIYKVNIIKYLHKFKYSYITGVVMLCLYADREKQWWHQQAFPWLHDARILFRSLLMAPMVTIWYSSIQDWTVLRKSIHQETGNKYLHAYINVQMFHFIFKPYFISNQLIWKHSYFSFCILIQNKYLCYLLECFKYIFEVYYCNYINASSVHKCQQFTEV